MSSVQLFFFHLYNISFISLKFSGKFDHRSTKIKISQFICNWPPVLIETKFILIFISKIRNQLHYNYTIYTLKWHQKRYPNVKIKQFMIRQKSVKKKFAQKNGNFWAFFDIYAFFWIRKILLRFIKCWYIENMIRYLSNKKKISSIRHILAE